MRGKQWTEYEIVILKSIYPDGIMNEMIMQFNCSKSSIYNKAHQLGLRKSLEFLRLEAERLKTTGAMHRYTKGQSPVNKGKKQTEYMNAEAIAKTIKTRFKLGQTPHNAKPEGYISTRSDKNGHTYQWIKVPGHRTLILLHQYIWTQSNGPIQKDHNIVFKDGDTLNCVIDNLECISDKELMLRNSIQRYPTELKKLIRITSKSKKQIKEYEQTRTN